MKFRYIKGGIKDENGNLNLTKIEGTVYYKLLEKTSDGKYLELARQEMVTGVSLMDKGQGILGPIGKDGKPLEHEEGVNSDFENTGTFIPLAELTDNGYVYYLRFECYMQIKSRGSYLKPILVSGRLYFNSQEAVHTFSYNRTMTVKSDGVYLTTNLGDINVYKRDIADVENKEAVVFAQAKLYSALNRYHRTDYIPLDVLTDGLENGYCLGALSDSEEFPYGFTPYVLAFYDEELSFLCGVTADEIKNMFNRSPIYLKKEEIVTLIKSKLGESDYTAAKYLIFSSHTRDNESGEGAVDLVSTEIIYFPLNKYDVDSILARNGKFVVQAIGDGFFNEDSEYSNEEPKTFG